ncbi:MAG: hypothetical protein ACK4SF_13830 [Algoriphagus aquaeductus]|uniref:hypothetical protein n=1 Tax=Algoriphagus aquaeductus TaxID=475299 RepID=UPI003919BDFC
MTSSKFSLADLLTVLTALGFSYICFLGLNFYSLGNTSKSILNTLLILTLLGGTALGTKVLKKTSRNFKTSLVFELILLTFFLGLIVIFSISPFPHYFHVNEQKDEIQKELIENISQAENLFREYEEYALLRENMYKNKLNSIVNSKRINSSDYEYYGFTFDNISDDLQIQNKLFTIHAELFPSNYSDSMNNNGIKEVATEWLQNAKKTTTNWKSIGIVSIVNDVEKNTNDWKNILVSLSKVKQKGENAEDFNYELSFENVKGNLTTLKKPNTTSTIFAIGTCILMLFSYFISERHSKSPGFKKIVKQIIRPNSTVKEKGNYDIDY